MKILVDCTICGWPVYKEKSSLKIYPNPVCSRECQNKIPHAPRKPDPALQVTKPCVMCGTLVTRPRSAMLENCCCTRECTKRYTGQRMATLSAGWNKDKMTPAVREKLRNAHLGKGEGKAYRKTYSRHTHRIVAEQILGRPLLPGEIVHHEDENKLNNDPSNIRVFASQAEHARYHALKKPFHRNRHTK